MDRDELDGQLRQRRGWDEPFRRGTTPQGQGAGGSWPRGYEPFRPEPEDEVVRRAPGAGGPLPRADHTPPGFDERPAPPPPPPPPVPVYMPPPPRVEASPPPMRDEPAHPPVEEPVRKPDHEPAEEPSPAEESAPVVEAPAYEPPSPPAWEPPPARDVEEVVVASAPWEDDEDSYNPAGYRSYADDDGDQRGGIGPLMVGLFVVLGIVAVGIGAVLSGVFGGGIAQATPTPTPLITQQASPSPTVEPTLEPTLEPTVQPTPGNGSPIIFPDGFTAETQPCAEQPDRFEGCGSSGATVSDGAVWVWIGFRKGNDADEVSVTIVNAAGATAGESSLLLGDVMNCGDSCNGWLRFRFGGLAPGNYGIRIARNGLPAAEASFTVLG